MQGLRTLAKTPWGKWRWKNLDWNPSFLSPGRGTVSQVMLTLATANMNRCIHRDGLSAHVLWPQCNELTSEQLSIADRQVTLLCSTTCQVQSPGPLALVRPLHLPSLVVSLCL